MDVNMTAEAPAAAYAPAIDADFGPRTLAKVRLRLIRFMLLLYVVAYLDRINVGVRPWIARIMITWGVLAAAMAFVRGTTSFYVVRFLLGIAEAGFFPGMLSGGLALINSIGNLGGF